MVFHHTLELFTDCYIPYKGKLFLHVSEFQFLYHQNNLSSLKDSDVDLLHKLDLFTDCYILD